MTTESPAILERLVRDFDLGWMIDRYAPPEEAIPFLLNELETLTTEFRNRFQYGVSFAPETLLAAADRNPHKIRAFLQALGVSRNPEMLLMVWRILQGLSIREVAMHYLEQKEFKLEVTLVNTEYGQEKVETYSSNNIRDANLVRFFGITTVDGQPLFDGFFPLRAP